MCRSKTRAMSRLVAAGVAAAVLGTMLGACSDLYVARRDSIALSAGDAIAANEAQQVVDPWPPQSGNTQLAANGQKMQAAVERYRTDKVIPPTDPDSLISSNQSGQTINQTTVNTGGASPPASAPAQ